MGVRLPSDAEVIEILRKKLLVSSAVTCMPSTYILNATSNLLMATFMLRYGVVKVNDDATRIGKDMMSTLLNDNDSRILILHGSVSSTNGVRVVEKEETNDPLTKAREDASKQLHDCSFENLIYNIKECQGAPRIQMFDKINPMPGEELSIDQLMVNKLVEDIGPFLRIQRPVELNYKRLKLLNISGSVALNRFLSDIIKYEAGVYDTLNVPISLLSPVVKMIHRKLIGWGELALAEAANSSYASIQFDVVDDPWAALAQGL